MKIGRRAKTWSKLLGLLLALVCSADTTSPAENASGESLRQLHDKFQQQSATQKTKLAGLNVAIWTPATIPAGGAPLIIFSHGFHGYNAQTKFLMKALSDAGYLVISPNHRDAIGEGHTFSKPEIKFSNYSSWSDITHKDRADDIARLIDALHQDQSWNSRIDWTKFALAGHSLGGYTALGLAGAWPSWKLSGVKVKAVLALSPYCHPFAKRNTLRMLDVPVMYQSGTRDLAMAYFIGRAGGAFDQAPSSAIYVLFDHASHFAFSDLNLSKKQRELIKYYSLAFLNKYVLNDASANPVAKLAGVQKLKSK